MAFWDKVNNELKRAVEEGWGALKEGARVGKLRLKVHSLHRKAQKHFNEIGGIVYDMAGQVDENPLNAPKIKTLIAEIRRIEEDIAVLEEELTTMRKKEGRAR